MPTDGSLAVLFTLASLTDTGLNYCPTQCLPKETTTPSVSISHGVVMDQFEDYGQETYLRYNFASQFGPVRPAIGASVTSLGDLWIGLGGTYLAQAEGNRFYTELHLMTGYYHVGNGVDLGHPLEFRAGAEFGYQFSNGSRLGIAYDHRSNADLGERNPGIETVRLSYTVNF